VRLRPTELGWKGLLLLAAMAVAFFATAYSNLFFLLLVFCCALGGLGAWWTVGNVRGITLRRLAVPHAAAGIARPVDLVLGSRRTRYALDVAIVATDGAAPIARPAVVDGTTPLAASLGGRPRGVATVTAVRVASRFPLGLFEARVDLPCPAEVVTGPDASRVSASRSAAAASGRPAELAAVRPFRAGDAVGLVHWKATARRGVPVVKELEPERADAAIVIVDRRGDAEALETALANAAANVDAARAAGRELRLLSQDTDFAMRPTDPLDAVQRWLATAALLPREAPPPPVLGGQR
jgi:uncharacterized protein (DUF58 family)